MMPEKTVWYYKTSVLVIALLVVGPLALPLLWWNPRFKRISKIGITALVLVLTWYLTVATVVSIQKILQFYNLLTQ